MLPPRYLIGGHATVQVRLSSMSINVFVVTGTSMFVGSTVCFHIIRNLETMHDLYLPTFSTRARILWKRTRSMGQSFIVELSSPADRGPQPLQSFH